MALALGGPWLGRQHPGVHLQAKRFVREETSATSVGISVRTHVAYFVTSSEPSALQNQAFSGKTSNTCYSSHASDMQENVGAGSWPCARLGKVPGEMNALGRGCAGSCLLDSEELLRVPPNPTGAWGLEGASQLPPGWRGLGEAEPRGFPHWVCQCRVPSPASHAQWAPEAGTTLPVLRRGASGPHDRYLLVDVQRQILGWNRV